VPQATVGIRKRYGAWFFAPGYARNDEDPACDDEAMTDFRPWAIQEPIIPFLTRRSLHAHLDFTERS
jgi:hypothetical protein